MCKKVKSLGLFFIIILFVLLIVIAIFFYIDKIKGKVYANIDGTTCNVDLIKLTYNEKEGVENVKSKNKSNKLEFKNHGSKHGLYEYTFMISNDEITITPRIRVFKSDWWDVMNITLSIDVYNTNGEWNTKISAEVNGRKYEKIFYDIENTDIEYRIE